MGETIEGRLPPIPEPELDPPCRRFTLLDGMILIAAAAVWMALSRSVIDMLWTDWHELRRRGLSLLSRPDICRSWEIGILNMLMLGVFILTPTFLVLRLRRPRPPMERLSWQPGWMACWLICWEFIPVGILGARGAYLLSSSVAIAWLAAWWTGRIRPEPGWIDGLGRFLGACWISLAGFLLLFRWW